ncbi:MAG TPA: hypothetical protein VMT57_02780 [Candidatus Thermoplasmatota archaeon]|nr:hypothetical protein [Candidatus Thermoplasmatota archaeon]
MAKKERPAKSFARSAPKSQEKYLIENAKKLRHDPFLVLPAGTDDSTRYFRKLKRQLKKIQSVQDDEEKLERFANKKGLDGALAGTLLLAISEKAPFLAALTFPTGEVTYAQRGKADKEKLIAVQHFDDPVYRLRGIRDLVFKKKLHVYSWDNGYVCTGKKARPPAEFIDFITSKLSFPATDHVVTCPHIPTKTAQEKEYLTLNYLRIEWKPAQTIVAICENCAKSTKNTMFTISKYILQRNLSEDFDIGVMTQVGKHSELSTGQRTKFLQQYLSGELTDYEIIRQAAKSHEASVRAGEEKILVLDGVTYGTDVDAFVNALNPTPQEREALEFILNKMNEPLIVAKVTPNKILERFWQQHGKEYLKTIVQDPAMAESLFDLDDTPSVIITHAFEFNQRKSILAKLPKFPSLPPLARFADAIARTYKTFGEKNALIELKKHPDTPKGKAIAYAFLLTFGKAADLKWQYSKQEIDYGEYLAPYIQKLLSAESSDYRKALQDLLNASGSSETLPI